MMQFLVVLVLFGAVSAQLEDWGNYSLIWEDQFDFLDPTKWVHEVTAWGGGNSEFQVYTPDPTNSYVSDGILYIKPTLLVNNTNPLTEEPFGDQFLVDGTLNLTELYGVCTLNNNDGCYREGQNIPPIMSGRLRSFELFSFQYGRVRASARTPTGDWVWPAIWLLPELWVFGDWPRSGEIDIMESRGNEDLLSDNGAGPYIGYQHMGSTLHWGPSSDNNRFNLTTQTINNDGNPYGSSFHLYELDWSEAGFRFFVDDVEILNIPSPLIPDNPDWTGFYDFGAPYEGEFEDPNWTTLMAPFDQEFHFLINVAVGGTNTYFPDDVINRGGVPEYQKPWTNDDGYYEAFRKFYDRIDDWYWTWTKEGDNLAMQVDFIEVYQRNE